MSETDHLILGRDRIPSNIQIGDEVDFLIRGRVRRIEADQIDVTGYGPSAARAVLEGDVFVEFTILNVTAYVEAA